MRRLSRKRAYKYSAWKPFQMSKALARHCRSTPPHFYPRTPPPAVPAAWIRNIPTGSAQRARFTMWRSKVRECALGDF